VKIELHAILTGQTTFQDSDQKSGHERWPAPGPTWLSFCNWHTFKAVLCTFAWSGERVLKMSSTERLGGSTINYLCFILGPMSRGGPSEDSGTIKAGLGFVWNERAYSVESSLQGISSNLLLWKRNELLVVIQTWSWYGKPAASARAWLREANAKR